MLDDFRGADLNVSLLQMKMQQISCQTHKIERLTKNIETTYVCFLLHCVCIVFVWEI